MAVGIYFALQPYVGTEEIGWMCILGAAPFAACGFFTYHGMTAEQVLWAWFKSEILCPKRLVFKSDSYYYEAVQPAIRAGIKRKRGLPIALTPLEYQSLIDRLKESKVITGINDEYRKLAGDEAESNIRIDIPVPYSGVCPYVYQDENPVPISPRIATNGDVYLCQSFMDQRYCLGNINKDSLPHALFNENFINLVNFMTTGRFYMDDCNKCVLKYQCPRGCIGDCLANGSIHETDGGCFFRKENAIRQLLKQSEAIVAEHMQF